jgi:hypothetical protein
VARLARLIGVSAGIGVAVWLLPASIHIIGWQGGSAARVALLQPLWKLAMAVGVVVAGGVVAGLIGGATVEAALLPFGLLWLWAVPYSPWISDRAPALLALAGPLRWAIVAIALASSLSTLWRGRAGFSWRPGRWTIFAVSLALYLGFGLWSAAVVGPSADEPHYLVITQSLIRDHDLAIENNHARGDYREYFGSELKPDFLRRGLNDVIYSIHAPGLPALLTPAYAAGGYRGAVLLLCVFGALAALAVFDLAALISGPVAALAAWAAVCLTVPFVPHAWLIFPEMPGAMLVAWAALWLYAPLPQTLRAWLWRGAALGLLPWLHTKFVILLAGMAGALALRLWRQPRAVAALIAPVAISTGLWFLSFYALYGSFDPQIPYGDFPRLFVLVSNIPRGVLGLLFDQKFGLLPYAPIYLMAIAGGWAMLSTPRLRLFVVALIAISAGFVASSTRMYMWWGGSSAPARFLVPILPLLAPMIAVAFERGRPAARTAFGVLLGVSLGTAGIGVWAPQRFMLFSAPHGYANFVDAMQGGAPLTFLLPMFTEGVVRSPLELLLPWLIAAVLAAIVVAALSRLTASRTPFASVTAGLVTFAIGGAILAGAPASAEQRRAIALRGRQDLLGAIDSSLRGLDYARHVRLNARQTVALGALTVSRADGQLTLDPRRLAGPFSLPAGRFTARLLRGDASAEAGDVIVAMADGLRIAHAPAISGAPLTFTLAIDAPVWIGASSRSLADSIQSIEIVPDEVIPRAARPDISVHAIEAIGERDGAFLVYADDDSYPEGGSFWTRGTNAATVLVVPHGASVLTLTLHVGPTPGRVRVLVDAIDRSITLAAGQTQALDVPLPANARLVRVEIQAPGSFRPSDHEPGSNDRRSLGAQVKVGLR